MVENRSLLRVDLFSHTRFEHPWTNVNWLSQIILYLLYAGFGLWGLAFYTALLATVGLVLIYLQLEGDPMLKAFIIVLAAAASAVFWSPRPHMMSFLLSSVVLYLLWLYRKRGVDRLWLIPPVIAVWGNLHGGYALGFILLILTMLGEGVRWLMDRVLPDASRLESDAPDSPSGLQSVRRIAVVGLVSALALSINPFGPALLIFPFRTVGIGVLRDFIQEWASPNFHQRETWPFLWIMLATLGTTALSPKRLGWTDLVLVAGMFYSALLAGRNIPIAAIVAAPVLSEHADAWLQARGYRLQWKRIPSTGGAIALNWLLLLLLLAAGAAKIAYTLSPSTLDESTRKLLPTAAVAYLEKEQPPRPIFNSYNWGGYLMWEARDYPVYVDGRTDLYDDELLRVYLHIVFVQNGWQEKLAEGGINTVLIEPNSALAEALRLSDGWSEVYEDHQAAIFVRDEVIDEQ